jgi:hypothetical protein
MTDTKRILVKLENQADNVSKEILVPADGTVATLERVIYDRREFLGLNWKQFDYISQEGRRLSNLKPLNTLPLDKLFVIHLNKQLEERAIKRPRIEKSASTVTTFRHEGITSSNFVTLRSNTVKEIIRKSEEFGSVLLKQPTFTGKTSLLRLIEQQLDKDGVKVISVTLLGYQPSEESLKDYWKCKTGLSIEDFLNLTVQTYLLIDEFQMIYPANSSDVAQCYEGCDNAKTAAIHSYFHGVFKQMMLPEHNIRIICFSGYGSIRPGSIISTPFNFGYSTSNYAKLSIEEYDELIGDFIARTQIIFLRQLQTVPKSFKEQVFRVTEGHVGYTSTILHTCNSHYRRLTNETELIRFCYSSDLFTALLGMRPTPKWEALSTEEREALKLIWMKEDDILSRNPHYMMFVRRGWITTSNNERVKLVCPLSKHIFLMKMYGSLRPTGYKDQFQNLCEFMEFLLSRLSSKNFKETLSIGRSNELSESIWQAEFYRLGYPALSEGTQLSVEVQKIQQKKLKGKVDFYINSNRQWAVEFLIRGELADSRSNTSRVIEHLRRFSSTGRYSALQPQEYLVVDFRPKSKGPYQDILQVNDTYKNLWIVIYDDQEWRDLKLVMYDKEGKTSQKQKYFVHH